MSTRRFCDGCGKDITVDLESVKVRVSLGPITHEGDVCGPTREACAAKHFNAVQKFLADGGFAKAASQSYDGPLST